MNEHIVAELIEMMRAGMDPREAAPELLQQALPLVLTDWPILAGSDTGIMVYGYFDGAAEKHDAVVWCSAPDVIVEPPQQREGFQVLPATPWRPYMHRQPMRFAPGPGKEIPAIAFPPPPQACPENAGHGHAFSTPNRPDTCRWCGKTKEEVGARPADRFYMAHGLWHDSETGEHLYTQEQYDASGRNWYVEGAQDQQDGTLQAWAKAKLTQPAPGAPAAQQLEALAKEADEKRKAEDNAYRERIYLGMRDAYENAARIVNAASSARPAAPAPNGWWTTELRRIKDAYSDTPITITDDMKRAINIALKVASGERWDDTTEQWLPSMAAEMRLTFRHPGSPADMTHGQELLHWNRAQANPPIRIGAETAVARKARELMLQATTPSPELLEAAELLREAKARNFTLADIRTMMGKV